MRKLFSKINVSLISAPYPYYYLPGNVPGISLLIFLSAFFFLYFFQPFQVNFDEHKFPFFVIALLQSLLPSLLFAAYFAALFRWLVKGNENSWTVGKELLHLSIVLFLMGSGNFLLRELLYDNPDNWSAGYFFEEIGHTYLVGFLLLMLLVPANYARLKTKNEDLSEKLNNQQQGMPDAEHKTVPIETQLPSEHFKLAIQDFLYAQAEGNYVLLFTSGNTNPERQMKRMTLSQLETQLSDNSYIMRVHRAYLANIHKVKHVAGNAQGLQLTIENCNETIPVARSRISAFKAQFHA
jgi:hypothetical protein